VSGAGGVAALQDLLSKKALRHDMLLTALEAGGALARLPGAVGAALFSHAQQLAAAAAALELLPELGAAAQDGIAGGVAPLYLCVRPLASLAVPCLGFAMFARAVWRGRPRPCYESHTALAPHERI
jgi:hypothetical protein